MASGGGHNNPQTPSSRRVGWANAQVRTLGRERDAAESPVCVLMFPDRAGG
jgi:hypothetical protein